MQESVVAPGVQAQFCEHSELVDSANLARTPFEADLTTAYHYS